MTDEDVRRRNLNDRWQLAGFFEACSERPDLQANADRLLHMGDKLNEVLLDE